MITSCSIVGLLSAHPQAAGTAAQVSRVHMQRQGSARAAAAAVPAAPGKLCSHRRQRTEGSGPELCPPETERLRELVWRNTADSS